MKLTAKSREKQGKAALKQARREGTIPAVFYSEGQPGRPIEVETIAFDTILRSIKPGRLSTTVFTLGLDGKSFRAVVKDIQYELTTYKIIHLDFEELKDNVPVSVKVPLECVGIDDCVGIKAGGLFRQIIRTVKVKCLPKNIPAEFLVDIRELGIRQVLRLSDIAMPEGVQPLTADEVVVVIAKR